MKVTIVTSVLNGAATLSKCLESVARQTLPCEHIIVDGGSTDETRDLVRAFGSNGIRLIEAPGASISRAFNIGVQELGGELIGVLNADDWLEPDAVARTVAGFEQQPEAGFSYGAVIVHEPGYTVLANPLTADRIYTRASLIQMPFNHISSMVKRSVYEMYGLFDEAYRIAMDFDFYCRIITRGVKGVFIPGVIGHVQGGGKSSNLPRRWSEYWRISSKHIGLPLASYHITRFAIRTIFFESLRRIPGGIALLRRRKTPRFQILS